MEKTENLNCEHVYINIDEKNEKSTKKLLDDSSSTITSDPFCCSNIFYCLFGCCFLLCE